MLPPYVPKAALSSDDQVVLSPQFLFVEDGFLMKTSSLGTQGSRLAYSEGIIHQVKEGESVEVIAKQYRLKPETIKWSNNLPDLPKLTVGQELVILPVDGVLHMVRRGQTVARIAQLYDISLEDISRQNNIRGGLIVTNQQLIIPGGHPLVGTPGSSSLVASAEENLRFTDRLPARTIQLKLKEQEAIRKQKISKAPTVKAPTGQVVDATSGTLQMPCNNCYFTQYYHPGHYAADIQTRGGGPVFAAEGGIVVRADNGWNGGYGNVLEIDHGNGLVSLYGHNKAIYVGVGDSVTRGQEIAAMGNTGLVYGATGIHTHFEVRVDGVKKNPLLYLE